MSSGWSAESRISVLQELAKLEGAVDTMPLDVFKDVLRSLAAPAQVSPARLSQYFREMTRARFDWGCWEIISDRVERET